MNVHAVPDIQAMGTCAVISMNAALEPTIVMPTQRALTTSVHSPATVTPDTPEMALSAMMPMNVVLIPTIATRTQFVPIRLGPSLALASLDIASLEEIRAFLHLIFS